MDSRSKRICLTLCLVLLTTTVTAFLPPMGSRSTTARQMAAMDPNDLTNFVHQHPALDAILSTLYSHAVAIPHAHPPAIPHAQGVDNDLIIRAAKASGGAAHGHSNPLFGPPDPLLLKMKSIPPTHLENLGVEIPAGTPESWPEAAKVALQKGNTIVDSSKFTSGGGSVLPGFKPTGGILPRQVIHDSSLATIDRQTVQEMKYWNILKKLPFTALVYAFLDFRFLRYGVFVYKEDIEEEPREIAAETLAVTGVRLGVFFLLGLVTVFMFGQEPPTPPV